MKKLLTLLSMAVGIFAACQQEDIIQPNEVPENDKVIVNLAIDGAEEVDTKSVVTIPETGIANLTLFIFQNGKCSETIYATPTNGKLSIISEKGYASDAVIDVYGVLNMGDRRSAVSEGESVSALEDLRYAMSNISTLNSNGFPMSGYVNSAPVGTPFTLHMRRLTAKYGFKINTNLKYGTFTVTSLQFKNAARYTYPFTEECKATSTGDVYASAGDYATSANLNNLNNGYGVNFYALENCQGTLLPGNTDPWKKIPDNISTKKDLCTYIEVKGSYTDNSGGLKATHTYRMYLGQDNTTNFDVIRNTMFNYTLSLSDDGFLKANWKAERVVNSDSRSLSFAKSTYEVEYGEDCEVVVNYSPKKFDCKFTLSQNLINAGVSFDPSYMVLRQSRELDADVTGTLTATSWDGVKTATCNVVAKKHEDDIIIIIKPESTALKMTAPYTDVEIGAYMGDQLLSDDYIDFEVETSNENVLTCNLEHSQLTAKAKGSATLTAKYTRNGQTYTASQDFTVTEDRTISVTTASNSYQAQNAFPIQIKSNFDGTIQVESDDPNLQFSSSTNGTFSERLEEGITIYKNSSKTIYGKYVTNNIASPTIKAYVERTDVKGTKVITTTKATNLTLTITDWKDFPIWDTYPDGMDCYWDFGIVKKSGGSWSFNSFKYYYDHPTPNASLYYFEDDIDNTITGTVEQWQNLINITCDDDSYSGDGWIDSEYESLYLGATDYPEFYENCNCSDIWTTIRNMIANECDGAISWMGGQPPVNPPVTKPTKTFYLWPSRAYYKDYQDDTETVYIDFSTNDYNWKHIIQIELAFPDADWADQPWYFGPDSYGKLQIEATNGVYKWNTNDGKVTVDTHNDPNVKGYYPERMWIYGVKGKTSSEYEINYTYESVTGFSAPQRVARSVTIEESDCIYEYVIQF